MKSKYWTQGSDLLKAPDMDSLTEGMSSIIAKNDHHRVAGELGAEHLVNKILDLGSTTLAENSKAIAELGRLIGALPEFSDHFRKLLRVMLSSNPPDMEILESARQKYFFAQALFEIDAEWIVDYCLLQALNEDQAERARKKLLERVLRSIGNLDELVHLLAVALRGDLRSKKKRTPEHRLTMTIETVADVANETEINVGSIGSVCVAELLKAYLRVAPGDNDARYRVFESVLKILIRIVQRQMFHLLMSETYEVIPIMKAACRLEAWRNFVDSSKNLDVLRSMLLDAVTMLAGQEKTDRNFMRLLDVCFDSPTYLQNQLSKRLDKGSIDPGVREWWVKLGKVKAKSVNDQPIDLTVDQQLALLKLNIEDMNDAIGKLRSDVAPILHISDPILAPVITSAASQFEAVARTVRRLCRIRKLESMGLAGARVEFNPRIHEFYSENSNGVRKAKVVRDGVVKDYGGSKRPILKALVKPLK